MLQRRPHRVSEAYFELGGNDELAIGSFGSTDEWRMAHPWAVERRAEILRAIAAELVRQQAPGTIWHWLTEQPNGSAP